MSTNTKHQTARNPILNSFAALLLMVISSIACGGVLSDAKLGGLIGEGTNGYIGLIKDNTPQNVKDAVLKANNTRKNKYIVAAQKGNTSLSKVEVIGGQRWINKTVSGNYIQNTKGDWIKK